MSTAIFPLTKTYLRPLLVVMLALIWGDGFALADSKIAFVSNRDGNSEIYIMNADGSGQTNISNLPASNESQPSWSPDGSQIVFTSVAVGANRIFTEIWVMDADGSNKVRLTNDSKYDFAPDWSPDGSQIAFARWPAPGVGIFVMDADGSNQTQIASGQETSTPRWTADGRITFDRGFGNSREIWVMNGDGSGQQRLTFNGATDIVSHMSPDLSQIAFTSDRDGVFVRTEVYVMNSNGTGQTRLTNSSGVGSRVHNQAPRWSLDGGQILFHSTRDDPNPNDTSFPVWEVYVMNADGSGQTNLTNSPGSADTWPVPSPDTTLTVLVDVKPGSDPNSINLKSNGLIPVAILSDDDFDAVEEIHSENVSGIVFGRGEASPAHFGPSGDATEQPAGHVGDVNGDGLLDVVLHYRVKETGITDGDEEACISGVAESGEIEGCDSIRITPGSSKGGGRGR